jgi:hypothetical protein
MDYYAIILKVIIILDSELVGDCAVAQALSHWLCTAEARVHT